MLVEQRMYTLYPGKIPEYMDLYQSEGLEIQETVLEGLIGYFSSEVGPLNRVVHMWGFDSFEDRQRRRSELDAVDEWHGFLKRLRPLMMQQENMLLVPASFSPIH